MTFVHKPVLSSEVIEYLAVKDPKVYVDLTSGGGGHAELILKRYPDIQAVLLDRDRDAVDHLKQKFKSMNNVIVVKSEAGNIDKVLFLLKIRSADIVLADLGVSSYQFDTPSRGFSLKQDGPMDMRMDSESGVTALEYIKNVSETDLKNILSEYAQERESATVAKALKKAAEKGAQTTLEFADTIKKAKRFGSKATDPSTQVFMALRMVVNDEMGELEKLLKKSFLLLSDKGKMGIITFHSTEDRVVKRFLRERKEGLPYYINDRTVSSGTSKVYKPVFPAEEEVNENPRARSAKLRVIEKICS